MDHLKPLVLCGAGVGAMLLGIHVGRTYVGPRLAADQAASASPATRDSAREVNLQRPPTVQTKNIDGKAIAAEVRREVKEMADEIKKVHGVSPGLAVVLVGTRKDSQSYVRSKKKMAAEVNFHTVDVDLPETASQEQVMAEVDKLNRDPAVHAILVQLPLPKHIDEATVLKSIRVDKDADGFAAQNVGNLCMRGGDPPLAVPCTPAGCVELLQRSGVEVRGKNAVVIGRSNIVGMPLSQLLQSMDATVTICHSRTRDIAAHVRNADIVCAAIGKVNFVKGEWLKPGCVVIDVGINAVDDATKKAGHRLVGDVDYPAAQGIASQITPVPGGVGPMTIAMLLKNTLNLARHSLSLPRVPLRTPSSAKNQEPAGPLPADVQFGPQILPAAQEPAGLQPTDVRFGPQILPAAQKKVTAAAAQDVAIFLSGKSASDIWQAAIDAGALRNKYQELSTGGSAPAVVVVASANGSEPVSLVTLSGDSSKRQVICSAKTVSEAASSLGS